MPHSNSTCHRSPTECTYQSSQGVPSKLVAAFVETPCCCRRRSAEWYRNALDCGINYMDTARSYAVDKAGDGVMTPDEITIGEAIRDRDRASIVISTKTAVRDGVGARAELETSLKNLGTNYVDIIHLHALMTPDEREKVLRLWPTICHSQ